MIKPPNNPERIMGCLQCERLRNDFNFAIERNAELLAEFQQAVMGVDKSDVGRLKLELLEIEEKRREVRMALLAHDATHCPPATT